MIRIVLLSLAGFVVFAGCGMLFFVAGRIGIVAGLVTIFAGAVAIWVVEARTNRHLEADSGWNRVMKAEGEDLVERQTSERRTPD